MKAVYGDKAARGLDEALEARILTITPGWSEAYALFTKGEAPMVLSYTTSPAYHVIAENSDALQGGGLHGGPLSADRGGGTDRGLAREGAGAEVPRLHDVAGLPGPDPHQQLDVAGRADLGTTARRLRHAGEAGKDAALHAGRGRAATAAPGSTSGSTRWPNDRGRQARFLPGSHSPRSARRWPRVSCRCSGWGWPTVRAPSMPMCCACCSSRCCRRASRRSCP